MTRSEVARTAMWIGSDRRRRRSKAQTKIGTTAVKRLRVGTCHSRLLTNRGAVEKRKATRRAKRVSGLTSRAIKKAPKVPRMALKKSSTRIEPSAGTPPSSVVNATARIGPDGWDKG